MYSLGYITISRLRPLPRPVYSRARGRPCDFAEQHSGCTGAKQCTYNYPSVYTLNQPNTARINGASALNATTGGYTNTLSTADSKGDEDCL